MVNYNNKWVSNFADPFFCSHGEPSCSVKVDVCIYGATSAGVMAAYTARKMGKSVLLIEPANIPGGLSSRGLDQIDIGNKYVITGLSRDFYRRIGKHYGEFQHRR